MDSTRKKKLIPPFIVIIAGLIFFFSNMFDGNQEKIVLPAQSNLEKEIPVVEPKEDSVIPYIVLPNFPEDFSSPFALLNDFGNAPNNNTASFATPPAIPQMPGDMPVFSTDFKLPDMPSVGAAPGRDVFLKAVLYKPGRSNMAVLDDGANETIVVEGKSSPWGYVSKITANTVIIDGRTLSFDM